MHDFDKKKTSLIHLFLTSLERRFWMGKDLTSLAFKR